MITERGISYGRRLAEFDSIAFGVVIRIGVDSIKGTLEKRKSKERQ